MALAMETNVIYCGDNVEVLPKYIDPDSVDLIYIDPYSAASPPRF